MCVFLPDFLASASASAVFFGLLLFPLPFPFPFPLPLPELVSKKKERLFKHGFVIVSQILINWYLTNQVMKRGSVQTMTCFGSRRQKRHLCW